MRFKMKRTRYIHLFGILLIGLSMGLAVFPAASAGKERKGTEEKQFTLSAAGDCTLGNDISQSSSYNFNNVYSRKSPGYFLKKVKSVFEKDDLTLVNLEGTLTNRGSRQSKKWAFRGKPEYVKILQKGSVEAVCFSNNHSRDYGEVSRTDTMSTLKKADISYSTESRVVVRRANGVRVGMVSLSSIGATWNPETRLRSLMAEVRKKKPDVIVVSMHSGVEYTQVIQPVQKRLSHVAIDLGADLVLGHHPHVIQGIDCYKGRYIVYSFGNFCFGGNTNPPDKDTFIFQQNFVLKNGRVSRKKSTARVIPCRVSGQDQINNYQPVISKGGRKKSCIQRLNSYSKQYGVKITKTGKIK